MRASLQGVRMWSTRALSIFTTSTNWSATRSIITRRCAASTGNTAMPRSAPLKNGKRQKDRSTFRFRLLARETGNGPILRSMALAAKICGLSTEEAVTAASAGGAKYVGFVFYPPSPRAVTPHRAAQLCARVPARIARVGLFVDAEDRTIEAVLTAAP